MRIWVTRAEPEAEATARRLRDRGHSPLLAPVLEILPAAGPAPDLDGVGAIAFTSRNGVRAFAALCGERSLPCFAVGGATARAASDLGFSTVHASAGDAVALAGFIAERRSHFEGHVLHAAPEIPAGDLIGALKAHGVAARAHVVYRTKPLPLPPSALSAMQADPVELDGLLVHSPHAGRTLAGFPPLDIAAPELVAFCISPAVAEPLKRLDFKAIRIAAFPNEQSLLNLLEA
jgi:uroporphyrinogen-III synthase